MNRSYFGRLSGFSFGMLSILVMLSILTPPCWAQSALSPEIERLAKEVESRMIEWRRDFHQNPELSNREFRTSKIVAEHLQKLGLEVKTNVARTGVVGILRRIQAVNRRKTATHRAPSWPHPHRLPPRLIIVRASAGRIS